MKAKSLSLVFTLFFASSLVSCNKPTYFEKEGFTEIAKKFRLISEVETHHADVFKYFLTGYTKNKLYRNKTPLMWVCSECGHMETLREGWQQCPLCSSTKGFIEIKL
jgi:rubrerythrin